MPIRRRLAAMLTREEVLMRAVGHWTPRYVWDRLCDMRYCRAHPDHPWLTSEAIGILTTGLRPTDVGLEFGSGRSTLWFARRIAELTSVEHDPGWYAAVSRQLKEQELTNVNYVFAPEDAPDDRGGESEYVGVASRSPANSLDFVLVDGIYRAFAAKSAISRLRSGGWLVIDNVNWYLPSESRAPHSRRPGHGANGPVWAAVGQTLRGWRHMWTSNGVSDTAIFIKP